MAVQKGLKGAAKRVPFDVKIAYREGAGAMQRPLRDHSIGKAFWCNVSGHGRVEGTTSRCGIRSLKLSILTLTFKYEVDSVN